MHAACGPHCQVLKWPDVPLWVLIYLSEAKISQMLGAYCQSASGLGVAPSLASLASPPVIKMLVRNATQFPLLFKEERRVSGQYALAPTGADPFSTLVFSAAETPGQGGTVCGATTFELMLDPSSAVTVSLVRRPLLWQDFVFDC